MLAMLCCRGQLPPVWACAWSLASWSCQCLPLLLCRPPLGRLPESLAEEGGFGRPHSPSPAVEAEEPAAMGSSAGPDRVHLGSDAAGLAFSAAAQLTATDVLEDGYVEAERSLLKWSDSLTCRVAPYAQQTEVSRCILVGDQVTC